MALAVGRTTLPHYRRLDEHEQALRGRILLPVDEFVPPPARHEMTFSARLLVALPPRLPGRFRPIRVREDPEQEARQLESELQDLGLAVCVLGLGPDGHIALNQPGSPAGSRTRIVEIEPGNLARLGDVAPATHALTLGIATLLAARQIALVADGADKHAALERVLDGPSGEEVPASLLRAHPRCSVFVRDEP